MTSQESASSRSLPAFLNVAVWILAIGIALVPAVLVFYIYDVPTYLAYPILLACVAAGIAIVLFLSNERTRYIEVLKGVRFELLKVVWPTRSEVTQTAWLVLLFVCVVSLILWVLDVVASKLVALLYGM